MTIDGAKVKSTGGRVLRQRSDVQGSEEEGTLRRVRMRFDVELFLTDEQAEQVNKGNFRYEPGTHRIILRDTPSLDDV